MIEKGARFHGMSDHDLLIVIATEVVELKEHSSENNGIVADLVKGQLKLEGAIAFGRWALGITIGSAGIVGLVAIYVANGM